MFNLDQLKIAGEFFSNLEEVAAGLPFDLFPETPIEGEKQTIGIFDLPKLGELTQGEEFIWNQFIQDADLDKVWMTTVKMIAATLLLQFRHDPSWNLGKTLKLSQKQVDDLYNFFAAERATDTPQVAEEPEEEEKTPPKKSQKSSGSKGSGSCDLPIQQTIGSPTNDSQPVAAA